MFDNLRRLSDGEEPYYEEEQEIPFEMEEPRVARRRFLGMTPGQRLILSFLLLGTVIVMGLMCLMVTEKVFLF